MIRIISYNTVSVKTATGPFLQRRNPLPMAAHTFSTVSRIAASLAGGYAFTWGFTVLGISGLVLLGADFHDAEAGMTMLALLVFLGMFLWTFATSSLVRVWAVLAGGGAAMTAAAWMLQRSLIA